MKLLTSILKMNKQGIDRLKQLMRSHFHLTRATYTNGAAGFARQYNSLPTEQVLPGLEDHLPMLKALDIGCGSGRDAKWLAERGFWVDAIDPSEGMLREAKTTNCHPRIHYFEDRAPKLRQVIERGQQYDMILLSAVWMHLKPEERPEALHNILKVARQGAVILITLRHGPSPENRPMFEVSAEELRHLAAYELTEYEHVVDKASDDKLGRSDVWWDNVWLKLSDTHEDILRILKERAIQGPKSSTYKPVLLISIAEALQQCNGTLFDAARTEIPFDLVTNIWRQIYSGAVELALPQHTSSLASPKTPIPHLYDASATPAQIAAGIRRVMTQNGPLKYLTHPASGQAIFTLRQTGDGEWRLQMPTPFADAIRAHTSLVVSGAGEAIRRFLFRKNGDSRSVDIEQFITAAIGHRTAA